ncbi:unnamed protein product [Rangifer tarandus platyrhynchus]|uniref:Uncharacterized protein n=2 Tax=Rangifer tarandus platyrhynchus TaxID=3082113 RepID=A0ABN8Y4H6_RANTA|nr:unnamed protein product [Rangifer tarandus platyrhynchus]CAI9693071.1 unnamed protein product [Rangifer tarandus platyrhynchus]
MARPGEPRRTGRTRPRCARTPKWGAAGRALLCGCQPRTSAEAAPQHEGWQDQDSFGEGRDILIDDSVQPNYTVSQELRGTFLDFQDSFPIEAKQ